MIDGEGRREGVEGEEKVGGMEEGKDSDDRKTGKNEKKTKKQTHNDGRASEEKLIFLSKKTNSKEIIDNIFFCISYKRTKLRNGIFLKISRKL